VDTYGDGRREESTQPTADGVGPNAEGTLEDPYVTRRTAAGTATALADSASRDRNLRTAERERTVQTNLKVFVDSGRQGKHWSELYLAHDSGRPSGRLEGRVSRCPRAVNRIRRAW
jgi:hypothetical protein